MTDFIAAHPDSWIVCASIYGLERVPILAWRLRVGDDGTEVTPVSIYGEYAPQDWRWSAIQVGKLVYTRTSPIEALVVDDWWQSMKREVSIEALEQSDYVAGSA